MRTGKKRNFWMPDDEWNILKESARVNGISVTDLIKKCLEENVEELKSVRTQKARKRLDKYNYDSFKFDGYGKDGKNIDTIKPH